MLLHPVAIELTAGRRVLVCLAHGRCEITGRTAAFVTPNGFKVEPMKPGPEAPDRDDAWVDEQVKQGANVLTCQPRLLQTQSQPDGVPDDLLVRDRPHVLCDVPGLAPLSEDLNDQACAGRDHGMLEHVSDGHAQAVCAEAEESVAVEGELPRTATT